MGHVQIWRNIALTLIFLINLPATGFTTHYLYESVIVPAGPFIWSFEVLGLVVGASALLFIPALLIGRITVLWDLAMMFVFWVLWIAEAALVAKFRIAYYNDARADYNVWSDYYGYPNSARFDLDCTSISGGYCYELYVIQNLMISLFVLSFVHFTALLIYAVIRQSGGNPIWKTEIRRLNQPQTHYPAFTMASQVPWQGTSPASYGAPTMSSVAWETNLHRVPPATVQVI